MVNALKNWISAKSGLASVVGIVLLALGFVPVDFFWLSGIVGAALVVVSLPHRVLSLVGGLWNELAKPSQAGSTNSQLPVTPLVSVVIPAGGASATIGETLQSLVDQTASAFEVIIVRDGADPELAAVVEGFHDARFVLTAGDFGAPGPARNHGAALATAEWMLFLDADDLIGPNHLADLLAETNDPAVGLVYCGYTELYPDGSIDLAPMPPEAEEFVAAMATNCVPVIHACLLRTDIFRSIGGFDPSFVTCEDWRLWQRVLVAGTTSRRVGTYSAIYRLKPASLSRRSTALLSDGLRAINLGADELPVELENAGAAAKVRYALWTAGISVANEQETVDVVAWLDKKRLPSRRESAAVILSGLSHAACELPASLDLNRFQPGLTGLLEQLQQGRKNGPQLADLDAVQAHGNARKAHFENIFVEPDPWDYDNTYEVAKYEATMAMAPESVGSALEIGCAEGHFTEHLAPKCSHLVAADIATTAIARVQERMAGAGITNVSTLVADLVSDPIPSGQDLIVCSEMLYYVGSVEDLDRVLAKLVAALNPGGSLLMAHAFEACESGRSGGFGWHLDWGAKTMSERMALAGSMHLSERYETELYRIERYAKGPATTAPKLTTVELDREQLPVDIQRMALWNGYATTPQAAADEPCASIPLLMYHSVGDDALPGLEPYQVTEEILAEQCEHLRYHGYRSASLEQIAALAQGKPVYGRLCSFTFDDAFVDFAEVAWPLLEAYGFQPILFVPTGHLGEASEWDADYGPSRAILPAEDISRLAASGVTIGCHGHRHSRMTERSNEELASDIRASRAVLEELVGHMPATFAYPFGIYDERVSRQVEGHGFDLAFTTDEGYLHRGDDVMKLPRVRVGNDYRPGRGGLMLPQPACAPAAEIGDLGQGE